MKDYSILRRIRTRDFATSASPSSFLLVDRRMHRRSFGETRWPADTMGLNSDLELSVVFECFGA
jgi:hypothetical protein